MSAVLSWIELHPGFASWMQAIAGLLAILTALSIALLEGHRANGVARETQAREEARQARQEARELERLQVLRHSAAALVALAHRRVQVASNLIRKNKQASLVQMVRTHQTDLASMESQLLAFPAFELGDIRAADVFAQALVALRGARIYLDHQLIELGNSYEPRHEAVADKINEIAAHLEEMVRLLESIVGGRP